jgi:hypothetical protein
MQTIRTQEDNQKSWFNLRITILRGTLRKLMASEVFTVEEKQRGYSKINTCTDVAILEEWLPIVTKAQQNRQAKGICHTPVIERPVDVELEFKREDTIYQMRTKDIHLQQAAVNHALSALADTGLTEYERARL